MNSKNNETPLHVQSLSSSGERLGEGAATVLKSIFPGSFDPFTLGHADLVERALHLFGEVIVAVGYNERKTGWIPAEERVRALREYYRDEPRVTVVGYSGLTADLVHELHADAILRGVRNSADFLYEQTQAEVNHRLCGVDTVFLATRPDLASLSSSIVRELAHFGRDITPYLPQGLRYNLPTSTDS